MKIHVPDIEEEGLDIDFSGPVVEPGVIEAVGDVVAHLHLDRQTTQVTISGDITGTLRLTCSRCLTVFENPVTMDVELTYLPVEEVNRTDNYQIREDEININYYRDEEIDLSEVIQEQLLLSIPMKPLCHEECKGLCPHCGTNLNIQSCECMVIRIDPRMAVLKKLLERKE